MGWIVPAGKRIVRRALLLTILLALAVALVMTGAPGCAYMSRTS